MFLFPPLPLSLAHAGDRPQSEASDRLYVPVHVGIDAVTTVPNVEAEAAVHGLVILPCSELVGLSLYARGLMPEFHGVFYAGPSFHSDELTVTPSVGFETALRPLRVAGSVDWDGERFDAHAILEYGGTGLWYQGLADVWFKPVGLGVFAQHHDGFGPWAGLDWHHLELWTAGLYDPLPDHDGHEAAGWGVIAGLDWRH